MIGWLKYLPVHLRHDLESTDCRGPSFARAKAIHLLANGCNIFMRAPRHSSKLPDPPHYWKGKESVELPFRNYNSALFANENWTRATPLSRRWSYWTAWFAGSHSEMYMNAQLLRREEEKGFVGASFFHPRSFEFALVNYLNVRYGHHETEGSADFRAPVDWKIHQQLPIFSASFVIEKGDGPEMAYCFPISDDCIFWLHFSLQTINRSVKKDMEILARNIINSVSMDLSPQAKAQIERVKAECPDMSLTQDFAPLKWPIKKEDIETVPPSGRVNI